MIEKPKSKIIKDNKTKVNWKYFYHVLFVAVIIIEIYLIINEKNKIKEINNEKELKIKELKEKINKNNEKRNRNVKKNPSRKHSRIQRSIHL